MMESVARQQPTQRGVFEISYEATLGAFGIVQIRGRRGAGRGYMNCSSCTYIDGLKTALHTATFEVLVPDTYLHCRDVHNVLVRSRSGLHEGL